MYKFIDTNEVQTGRMLPSEALSINGEYIEDLIPGYRTLQVSGRELLESEIKELQVGNSDGTKFQRKRNPSRPITVQYQLIAKNQQEFRDKYNRLNSLLDVQESKLAFLDEPDKYYVGTKSDVGDVDGGTNAVTSDFTFYCADPYKYAIVEKTAKNNGSRTIVLNNKGTKSVPINVKALMKSDNGFLGLTLGDRFYQVGNPSEVDGEYFEQTDFLFDDHLTKDKGWLVNQGITPPVTPYRHQIGTIRYTLESEPDEGYANVSNYGSESSSYWHGASLTKIVPPDKNGQYATNWFCGWRFDFNVNGAINRGGQIGHNSVTFIDGKDNIICAVVFEDNSATYERADMAIYIGNKRVWDTKNSTSFLVTGRGDSGPAMRVEKIGGQISIKFSYAGINKSFFVDNPSAELRKITWYGATFTKYEPVRNNLLRALQVRKHNVLHYKDIPNYFGAGDIIELDSAKNELFVNNIKDWDCVDIGSKPLMLPPGEHVLGVAASDFATIPDITVRWRERWL